MRGFCKYSEPEYYKALFQVASQPHMSPAAKQVICSCVTFAVNHLVQFLYQHMGSYISVRG
jgi:hypothetical protein